MPRDASSVERDLANFWVFVTVLLVADTVAALFVGHSIVGALCGVGGGLFALMRANYWSKQAS